MDYKKKYLKFEQYLLKKLENNILIYIILLLFFGFLLRVFYLSNNFMWLDEGISSSVAKSILENGIPLLPGELIYERGIIFHYMMAGFIWLFGNDFGARFISVFFGTLTILLAYFYGRDFLKNTYSKYLFMIVISISIIEIIYSKQARFYQAFQFFYFLAFYLYYRYILEKNKFSLTFLPQYIVLIFSLYMCISMQKMGYILIPLFFIFYFIYLFDFKKITKITTNGIITFLGISILFLLMLFMMKGSLYLTSFEELFSHITYYALFFSQYATIIVIAILGFLGAVFSKEYKKHIMLLLLIIVPLVGILLVKQLSSRYVYFCFFIVFFYVISFFEKVNYKLILFPLFIIINIGTYFSVIPIEHFTLDQTMPSADYERAYQYIDSKNYSQETDLIHMWPPAAYWYSDKKDDFWIFYRVSGDSTRWMLNENRDKDLFSNSIVIYSSQNLPKNNFIVILDTQSEYKVDFEYITYFENHCYIEQEFIDIKILNCN